MMTKPPIKPISSSLEDYLEAIYKIIEEKQGVKAIDISRRLGVGRSSVTEALNHLADRKLINYGRYEVISLTPEGEKVAKAVILKHNVMYDFFTKILDVHPDMAQKEACLVEHSISEDTIQRFVSFMEFHNQFQGGNDGYLGKFRDFHKQKYEA